MTRYDNGDNGEKEVKLVYFTAERKEHLIPIQLLEYQMLWDGGLI